MDFKELKKKALEKTQKAIDYSANKLTNSSFTINKKEDLEKLIKKSVTTTFKNKETWVEKKYKHKSIAVFADEWSDFFKEALYIFPVIIAKAFTQNINVKLAKSKIEGVKLTDYKVDAQKITLLSCIWRRKSIKNNRRYWKHIKTCKIFWFGYK